MSKAWSWLIPNFLEVRTRRKYVLRAWFVTSAGVISTKFWPVISVIWVATPAESRLTPLLFAASVAQVVIALLLGALIAAKLESEGAHSGEAAKARDDRWRKTWLLYFTAGTGVNEWLNVIMGGG